MRLILFLAAASLAGQESTSAIPRNDGALQRAIAGLGKKVKRAAEKGPVLVAAPQTCSVRLAEIPIRDGERFAAPKAPAPEGVVPMPPVTVPAPPCPAESR